MARVDDQSLAELALFLDAQREKLQALMQRPSHVDVSAGIDEACDCVRDFHERNTVSRTCRLPDMGEMNEDLLRLLRVIQSSIAVSGLALMAHLSDQRGLRTHLACEELAEWIEAIIEGDEQKLLDAQADRLYVLCGDAVTFDLPLGEAFAEVHRSNLTKNKQPSDPHQQRLRAKGPDYVPPDLERVLRECREMRNDVKAEHAAPVGYVMPVNQGNAQFFPQDVADELVRRGLVKTETGRYTSREPNFGPKDNMMAQVAEERREQGAKSRRCEVESAKQARRHTGDASANHPSDPYAILALEWGVLRDQAKAVAYMAAYSPIPDGTSSDLMERYREMMRAKFGPSIAERRALQQEAAKHVDAADQAQ